MFSSNILFQARVVVKSVDSLSNSDGTTTITFDWDERTNAWGNLQNANHIAEGDVIFYSNAFISVNPKMQSFIIKEILSKSSTTVQCKIESRDSSDPVNAIYAAINQYCVISRPTSNLSLFPNVAADGQLIPDFFSEHVSNFNLRILDETISSLQQSGGGASVSVSETAPESPSEGDLWYDSENLSLKIFYGNTTDSAGDDVWVEISSTDSFVVQSSNLNNISDDESGGVVATGRIQASSLVIDLEGGITAVGGTKDFRNGIVNFSGADVAGLGDTIDDQVDFHLNKDSSVVGDQVLSWNGTDYEWVDKGSTLNNISDDESGGVVATGRIQASSLVIDLEGGITAVGGTKDFRNGIVNFSGADVAGLGDTIDDQVDFHLNKDSSVVGDQVLSWNGTDYEWVDLPDLSGYTTNVDLEALQAEVTAIKNAPETLDTFQELVDYVNGLDSTQGLDIINGLATLQADVDSNETAASDDRALIRTEFANADSTLQSNIDAVQSDVDVNETAASDDRDAIRNELSRRDSHLIHVDQYKSGTYTPDGSINKPYKTIQAAYDSAIAVSTILIAPGAYEEDLVVGANGLSSMISFIGLGGKGSNNVIILGNVEIHDPQTKVQMKDIRIESPDGTRPALLVNGCRQSSFQNMTIRYGVDSQGNPVVPTENVLKVTSIPNDGDIQDGTVDFLSCSIYPQGNGILVDGPNFRQVRFYRCNYGANITMPLTNMDTVYLYQCAAFGNITHENGVIVVDQSQITGFSSTASITPLKALPDYLQNYTLVNFVQITNSSLRLLSGGWGLIEKFGDSNYLIGNNDSNPNQLPPLQGDSLGEVEYQKDSVSDPNLDIEDYMGRSYLRHASEIHYSNKNNPWGQISNESIPYDVESALESLKNDLVDIHYNLYRDGDILVKSGVRERFLSTVNTGNIDFPHDCDDGHIINMETPQTNIHLKLTNLDLSVGEATTITVVIEQGANAYIPNELDIDDESQNIKWQGGAEPSGTADGVDVISFSILRKSGSYLLLGQLVDFS